MATSLMPREGKSLPTDRMLRYGGLGLLALLLIWLVWPFNSVPTGSRGVVTQFGRIVGIEPEGLALLPPWQRLALFSIRAEQADIENADGSTSDTQPVKVSMTVRYSIMPDKVAEVYEKYTHNGDLSSYVQTATQEIFKAVTARYVATDLIGKRAQVSSDINEALRAKLAIYGAQVINIDMRNFSFSQSYMAAINDKVTQEQLRLAAENRLKTVEAEQKQKVAIAEAEANAVKAKADGDAYATLKDATARSPPHPEPGPHPEQGRPGAATYPGRADQGGTLERPAPPKRLRRSPHTLPQCPLRPAGGLHTGCCPSQGLSRLRCAALPSRQRRYLHRARRHYNARLLTVSPYAAPIV